MAIPAVGSKLPDFTLKLATKEGHADATFSKVAAGKPVVLAFFPIAFSGVCTKEMCEVRDNLAAFKGLGVAVYGFSTDSQHGNVQFAKMHNLEHGIFSDPNREVLGKIWESTTVAGIHNVAKRGVMVVGGDGTVTWTSKSEDPTVWVGVDEVRKHL
ncbi:MAG: redoxin domain-containing protein [bacterium]